MARYTDTIASRLTPEETFDYMADFTSVTRWDPTAESARMLGDAPGEGTEFDVSVRFAGRTIELRYRTIEFERPRRLVLRAESSAVVSLDTVTVAPGPDGGALLTYDAELRPKGAMRLADPILGLLFRRLGDNAAAGLRRELG